MLTLFGFSEDHPSWPLVSGHRFSDLRHDRSLAALSTFRGPKFLAMDIKEEENEFQVTADLPGTAKEDVKIEVTEGILTVSAERVSRQDDEDEAGKWKRVERSYGKVSRSLELPPNADIENIKATLDAGVLHLSVAKLAEEIPRTRTVQVA